MRPRPLRIACRYAVAGDDADWDAALAKNSKKGKTPAMVSVRAPGKATPSGDAGVEKKRRRKSEGQPKSAKAKKKHKKRHA